MCRVKLACMQTIHGLEGLVNIVELDLSNNNIAHIAGLDNCLQLQRLVLSKNRISVIDNLWTLTKLEHLLLQGNPIATVESLNLHELSKLPRLRTLYLKNVNGSEVQYCRYVSINIECQPAAANQFVCVAVMRMLRFK
jgi:Leucine-rich repeat (LRR) protein